MPRCVKNLSGEVIGKLTVIGKSDAKFFGGRPYWLCKCECGNITTINGRHLSGKYTTTSCGCSRGNNQWIKK